jgi:hypothetical protein
MENRLFEVNNLANQSQIRLNDTNEVLKSLEERLRTTEVSFSWSTNLCYLQNLNTVKPDVLTTCLIVISEQGLPICEQRPET